MISAANSLRHALCLLAPLALILTAYLYLYPVFLGCAFPIPANGLAAGDDRSAYFETLRYHVPFLTPLSRHRVNSIVFKHNTANDSNGDKTPPTLYPTRLAPFRLLTMGDPQLEGDSSIPNNYKSSPFPHLLKIWKRATFQTQMGTLRNRIRWILHDLVDFYFEDIPDTFESIRKHVDHFGNDLYLSLIYRTIHWWTKPTHVTVLGDLVGSQWIDDKEFTRRGNRFWDVVFRGAERVPDKVAAEPKSEYHLAGFLGTHPTNATEVWEHRLINVAGNHDIGYAGDLTPKRLKRFEKMFGKANYELRFEMPVSETASQTVLSDTNQKTDRLQPELRIVVLNNMNLDTPAISSELQDATYNFIDSVITTSAAVEYRGHFTIVLTHIPLYKTGGICVDSPFFTFFDDSEGGGVREQNQLSFDASRGFLEGIFGMSGNTNAPGGGRGRPGVILNGHDHEGCDTFHFINHTVGESHEDRSWEVKRWQQAKLEGLPGSPEMPGIREITVRSMMGSFGGHTGLFSAWFDEETWEWQFDYATCAVGSHNLWWLVHIVDLVAIGGILVYPVVSIWAGSKVVKRNRVAFASNGEAKA